jgi:hypothetical protein
LRNVANLVIISSGLLRSAVVDLPSILSAIALW